MNEPVDHTGKRGYHSFLLRMWQEEPNDFPGQRIILEDPHTHELVNFSSLIDLIEFLHKINKGNSGTSGLQD